MSDDELRARLRDLDDLAYHRERAALAKAAGVGVAALDRVRAAERRATASARTARDEPGPWPVPVNGERLAAAVESVLRRYLVLAVHAYTVVTLWAIGTHAYAQRAVWPLLLARSPQPGCGKSTLLDVLERLVARAMVAANASLATLFRSAATGPTQLLDELDRWLARDTEVIGYLCAGWQSGRPFLRCDPETLELREYPCYGPRALALIGDVADEALRSRCIVVEMRRALPGERPERFRAARPHLDLRDLCAQASRWSADHAAEIRGYESDGDDLPGLTGRALDNAEALLAIAHAIGGKWPERCRAAVLDAPVNDSQDLGVMLLADLAELLDTLPASAEAIASSRIVEHLTSLDDRPWPTCRRGEPIGPDWLRRRLAPYDIRPDRYTISGTQQRGYAVAALREVVARYLTRTTHSDPLDEVSDSSRCLDAEPPDALGAPDSSFARHLDGLDASPDGSESVSEDLPW